MSLTRALVATLLGLLVVGCQSPPSAPAPTSRAQDVDPVAAARQALERRDWISAARLARRAIARDPANLSAHYSLAIAASYLDLRDEAIREFQWVMAHAPAGSQELQTARTWLAEAGLLPRSASASEPTPGVDPAMGSSSLSGRATWAEPGQPPTPQRRLQLHLIGLPRTPTQEHRYILRTDDDGKFAFKNVVPGPYEITNRIAGQPIWRLKVQLEPGQSMALDLTPDNSVKVRDDFPDSARPSG